MLYRKTRDGLKRQVRRKYVEKMMCGKTLMKKEYKTC